MHKKSQLFITKPRLPHTTACGVVAPTRRQLIAASEYAKDPALIESLSRKLAFVREEKEDTAKKKTGGANGK